MATYEAVARSWREAQGYVGRGGVIIIHDGEVQSWVNKLRNPEHWKPGCIAIDEAGSTWTAVVGSDEAGALMWLPCNPIT